jgi:hypothetical protein
VADRAHGAVRHRLPPAAPPHNRPAGVSPQWGRAPPPGTSNIKNFLVAADIKAQREVDNGSQMEVHGMSSNQYGATTVVVRRPAGVIDAPMRAVHASGGSVVQQVNTLNGISADVPSNDDWA